MPLLSRSLTRRLAVWCALTTLGTPALFNIAGHYAFYYAAMVYVPALIGLTVVFQELVLPGTTPLRAARVWVCFGGAVATAAAVGLPLRLLLGVTCFEIAPRSELKRIVESSLTPTDIVFSDYSTFFEAKNRSPQVYDMLSSQDLTPTPIPVRSFTPDEKKAVSVLIIRPEWRERLGNYFGGDWQPVTEPFGDRQDFRYLLRIPVVGKKFASHAAQPQIERYQVQVFRRVKE